MNASAVCAACDVQLADRQVSRRHAVVRRLPEGCAVFDTGSKNGLWVNGTPVDGMVMLADGDEISVAARFKLRFVDVDATPATLITRADQALYQAKRDGRNCIRQYSVSSP